VGGAATSLMCGYVRVRTSVGAFVATMVLVVGCVAVGAGVARADAGDPIGSFDSISVRLPGSQWGPNTAPWVIRGWAADPDAPGGSVLVHIYVDGVQSDCRNDHTGVLYVQPCATRTGSGDERPDVAAVYPFAGNESGWQATLYVYEDGHPHTVCTYAINVGAGSNNTTLGCKVLPPVGSTTNLGDPQGNLEAVTAHAGSVRFQGWSGDPDPDADPNNHLGVLVYMDGHPLVNLDTTLSRPDVRRAFPALTNAAGFDAVVPAPPGQHLYCVDAANSGSNGTRNTSLGCLGVDVPSVDPAAVDAVHGAFDGVSLDEQGNWFATGWVWDSAGLGPYPVVIRTVGLRATTADRTADLGTISGTTGDNRPDVQGAYPDAPPDTGFHFPVPPYTSKACAYALRDNTEQLLGCVFD